jgi:GNAT superfamily N-acetyltransferase
MTFHIVRARSGADIAATAALKRLYVRPAGRRLGIGKGLTVAIIAAAEGIGYAEMKLDTFPSVGRDRAIPAFRLRGSSRLLPQSVFGRSLPRQAAHAIA